MKYIIKQCPVYLLGRCGLHSQECKAITNCTMKNAVGECLQFEDSGRIELIMKNKNLTERGRLAKSLLKIFEVEEVEG